MSSETASSDDVPAAAASTLSIGVPMSMPALLVNPKPRPTQQRTAPPRTAAAGPSSATRKPLPEGKRRLLRSAHLRALTTGPGAARPTAADYLNPARPNAVRSTFPQPLPAEVARALKLSREEQMELVARSRRVDDDGAATGPLSARAGAAGSGRQGQFALGLREARRFLKERLGIVVRADREAALISARLDADLSADAQLPIGDSGSGSGVEDHALQRFADIVEDELEEWLGTEVYLHPDRDRDGADVRVVVDAAFARPAYDVVDEDYDERLLDSSAGKPETDEQEPCVVELSAAPHSLRWYVPSPLLRYAVHCLARLHGCPSFSKDATLDPAGPWTASASASGTSGGGGGGGSAIRRETWILNPNPAARGARRSGLAGPSHQPAPARRQQQQQQQQRAPALGLETPPTTDIGTDVGTDSEVGFGSSTEHEVDSELGDHPPRAYELETSSLSGADTDMDVDAEAEADPRVAGLARGLSAVRLRGRGRARGGISSGLNGTRARGGGGGRNPAALNGLDRSLVDSVVWSEDDDDESGPSAAPSASASEAGDVEPLSPSSGAGGADVGDETVLRRPARARAPRAPTHHPETHTALTTAAGARALRPSDLSESVISSLSLGGYEREDEAETEDDDDAALDEDSLSGSAVLDERRKEG